MATPSCRRRRRSADERVQVGRRQARTLVGVGEATCPDVQAARHRPADTRGLDRRGSDAVAAKASSPSLRTSSANMWTSTTHAGTAGPRASSRRRARSVPSKSRRPASISEGCCARIADSNPIARVQRWPNATVAGRPGRPRCSGMPSSSNDGSNCWSSWSAAWPASRTLPARTCCASCWPPCRDPGRQALSAPKSIDWRIASRGLSA